MYRKQPLEQKESFKKSCLEKIPLKLKAESLGVPTHLQGGGE